MKNKQLDNKAAFNKLKTNFENKQEVLLLEKKKLNAKGRRQQPISILIDNGIDTYEAFERNVEEVRNKTSNLSSLCRSALVSTYAQMLVVKKMYKNKTK